MRLEEIERLIESNQLEQALNELKINSYTRERDRVKGLILKSRVLNKIGSFNDAYQISNDLYKNYRGQEDFKRDFINIIIQITYSQWKLGHLDESLKMISEGLELLKTEDNSVDTKRMFGHLKNREGTIYMNKGVLDSALDCFQQCLFLWNELEDKEGKSRALNNIGLIYNFKGELGPAIKNLEESLRIKEELMTDQQSISSTLNNLGIIHESLGDFNKALKYHLKALALREKLGNKQDIAVSLNNIGLVYISQGEIDIALENFNKCLEIDKEIGNKQDIATSLLNIGLVHQYKGNDEIALNYYKQSLSLRKESGNELEISQILYYLCTLLADKGPSDTIQPFIDQLSHICESTDNRIVLQRYNLVRALVLSISHQESDQNEAMRILQKLFDDKDSDVEMTSLAMVNLCRLCLDIYSRTADDKIPENLQKYLNRFMELADKSQLHNVKLSMKFLQAKLKLLQLDFSTAEGIFHEIIQQAQPYNRLLNQTKRELENLKIVTATTSLIESLKEKKLLFRRKQLIELDEYLNDVEIVLKMK
ncbi:MAG: tetratricopeptide repeat protein [Candidatus Hodarchaeales archaeon]